MSASSIIDGFAVVDGVPLVDNGGNPLQLVSQQSLMFAIGVELQKMSETLSAQLDAVTARIVASIGSLGARVGSLDARVASLEAVIAATPPAGSVMTQGQIDALAAAEADLAKLAPPAPVASLATGVGVGPPVPAVVEPAPAAPALV